MLALQVCWQALGAMELTATVVAMISLRGDLWKSILLRLKLQGFVL